MIRSKVIGLIPARLASERLPNKMLIDIKGKTLIQRTYENALKCKELTEVFVATDSAEIRKNVESFGGKVIMTSETCRNGSDRCAEAAKDLDADVIVNIQGDEPDLDPMTIKKVVEVFEEDPDVQVSTACIKIQTANDAVDPSVVKCVFDSRKRALYFSRAMIPYGKKGEFNPENVYYKHFGIYAYRKDFLTQYPLLPHTPLQQAEDLEQLKILEHGFCIHVVEVEKDCVGIDTHEDLEKFITTRFH